MDETKRTAANPLGLSVTPRCYCGSTRSVVNGECRSCAIELERTWKAAE